jgi:oligopeptide/dipeptide ABC transporter ATP-binding protein
MYNGRLVELAFTDEMMNNPCHPYTLKLFSSVPGKQAVSEAADEIKIDNAKEKPAALPAAGCPYADLCSAEEQGCRQAVPDLREIRKGHFVACIRI